MKERYKKRWKTAMNNTELAAYLQDMAEEGLILEDMTALMYLFRESEPRYLRYRVKTLERFLSEEERQAYAAEGWQEVCHWELQYIFSAERGPSEEVFIDKQDIQEELDRQIEMEQSNLKVHKYGNLTLSVAVILLGLVTVGFSKVGLMAIWKIFPLALLGFWGSRRHLRELREKREGLERGEISEEYTDWRSQRKGIGQVALISLLLLGIGIYYLADFNEKTFDMPQEISYEAVPAVRLERLEDVPLERVGKRIDPAKEGVGIRLGQDIGESILYRETKRIGAYDNYGVEYKHLLKTKRKVSTKQKMQTEDGAKTLSLNTEYFFFRWKGSAAEAFQQEVRWEKRAEEEMRELLSTETDLPPEQLSLSKGSMDEIYALQKAENRIYMIGRRGNQIVELDYKGEASPERLLAEMEKVFAAQKKA